MECFYCVFRGWINLWVIWLWVDILRAFYVLDCDDLNVVRGDGDDGADDPPVFHLITKMQILTHLKNRPSLQLIKILPFVDCFFYNILLIYYTNLSF